MKNDVCVGALTINFTMLSFHRLCPALVVIVSCFTIGYKLMVLKWEREGLRERGREKRDEG